MRVLLVVAVFALAGCGTLEKKSGQISSGDTRARVIEIMGEPDDRQFKGKHEVLQYCITGAGFGFHDYRMIWLFDGAVTGINSYKDDTPGVSCKTNIKPVKWEEEPSTVLEIRNR